jgi:hypothetical protein
LRFALAAAPFPPLVAAREALNVARHTQSPKKTKPPGREKKRKKEKKKKTEKKKI